MLKVSDLIAQFLKDQEIKHVFGIIGSANSHIFDSIMQLGYTEIVCVHHEQAATMAMQTYFRVTGKVTAALVTAGGGSSNAITGVMSAWADSIPGIVISGQENKRFIDSMQGMRMWGIQGYDSSGMVSSITKYAKQVMNPAEALYELEKSYNIAQIGRPGPVWLDFPMDIQASKVAVKEITHYESLEPVNSDSKFLLDVALEEISKLISVAERPVFWLGHGVRLANAVDEIYQLLEAFPFPTIVSWAGLDMLDDDHPLNYGRAGVYGNRSANLVIQNADLVIAIGNRMAIPMIGYVHDEFAREAKIVQVDIDQLELEKTKDIADVSVLADAKIFIEKLIKASESISCTDSTKTMWKSVCDGYKVRYPYIGPEHEDKNGYINSYKFIDKLIAYFKEDQLITTDMGTALLSGHQVMRLKRPQRIMTSTGLGEMGFGLPAAIGASFASNKGEVMALNCDGGIMMNLQELQTIVHHDLPIKIFVFNNDGYLMIKHTQKNLFEGRYCATDNQSGVSCPDFSKIAYGFGIEYYAIHTWEDFDRVIPLVQASRHAVICDVFMDPEQLFMPKLSLAINPDGSIVSPPLEDISPLLPRDILQSEMIIDMHPKSVEIKA